MKQMGITIIVIIIVILNVRCWSRTSKKHRINEGYSVYFCIRVIQYNYKLSCGISFRCLQNHKCPWLQTRVYFLKSLVVKLWVWMCAYCIQVRMGITFASILQVSRCGPGHPDPQGHCLIVERTKRKKKKNLHENEKVKLIVDKPFSYTIYFFSLIQQQYCFSFILKPLTYPYLTLKKVKKKRSIMPGRRRRRKLWDITFSYSLIYNLIFPFLSYNT